MMWPRHALMIPPPFARISSSLTLEPVSAPTYGPTWPCRSYTYLQILNSRVLTHGQVPGASQKFLTGKGDKERCAQAQEIQLQLNSTGPLDSTEQCGTFPGIRESCPESTRNCHIKYPISKKLWAQHVVLASTNKT